MRLVWKVGMAVTLLLAAVAGCTDAAAGATKVPREPGVVHELNARNFDATVSSGRWLVEFYAPWCSSCRSFAPTYNALARAIAESPTGGSVRVARVDGWTYSVLCRRFRVNVFPSFVVLQGGYVYEHTGRWTSDGLLKFALPPPLPPSGLGAAQRSGDGHAAADGGGGDINSDGGHGTGTTRKYPAVAAQEDVVVNGARVDRPFGPMAPHWRLATYLSAVGGDIAAAGRDLSTVQLGGVVVGSGMALTVVIVLGLAVLTTPGVFKFD
ncbi:hypothetical protein MMPV_008646 [Pyropia vietnamensis]